MKKTTSIKKDPYSALYSIVRRTKSSVIICYSVFLFCYVDLYFFILDDISCSNYSHVRVKYFFISLFYSKMIYLPH